VAVNLEIRCFDQERIETLDVIAHEPGLRAVAFDGLRGSPGRSERGS
jgi:hypothetical protein